MIEVTYIDHMGDDLSVVNAARVSFGKKSDYMPRVHMGEPKVLQHKDYRLVQYLAKHKHISPFGHAFASFHVKAPVFVARQLVKHKFLRWNEISRRYVDDDPEFYFPLRGEDVVLTRNKVVRVR
jgi:thymidylate synthase (FAD)